MVRLLAITLFVSLRSEKKSNLVIDYLEPLKRIVWWVCGFTWISQCLLCTYPGYDWNELHSAIQRNPFADESIRIGTDFRLSNDLQAVSDLWLSYLDWCVYDVLESSSCQHCSPRGLGIRHPVGHAVVDIVHPPHPFSYQAGMWSSIALFPDSLYHNGLIEV